MHIFNEYLTCVKYWRRENFESCVVSLFRIHFICVKQYVRR